MPRDLRIASRLREFGLVTVEVEGWRTRGAETFNPRGVVAHHTGGPATGEIPELRVLINGRSDLPGPLCQVGLARSGACYVIAAGRANHAGPGGWRGLSGNTSVFGIEATNNGTQPWPQVQLDAYYRCAAALLTLTASPRNSEMVCGHKEWAPSRKPDPHSLSMTFFRSQVATILSPAPVPPAEPIPATEEDDMLLFQSTASSDFYEIWVQLGSVRIMARSESELDAIRPDWKKPGVIKRVAPDHFLWSLPSLNP